MDDVVIDCAENRIEAKLVDNDSCDSEILFFSPLFFLWTIDIMSYSILTHVTNII
jgi:hypothetical protein